MFDNVGVSIAVIDENMNMIYINKRGNWFYKHVFGAENLLGKNVESCHAPKNVENIKKLMQEFKDKKKSLSFFGVPLDIIEGGHLKVFHLPYFQNDKFIGIIEINIESSLEPGGRYEYKMH